MTPAAQYAAAMAKPRKPRKYRNEPIVVDGERFDSKAEARHWNVLRLRERVGEITNLRRQVRFPLEVNGVVVGAYVADMVFDEAGAQHVVDVKSAATRNEPTFRLKAKLMAACHGIVIEVVP